MEVHEIYLSDKLEEIILSDNAAEDLKFQQSNRAPITSDTELLYTKIDLMEKEIQTSRDEAYREAVQDCEKKYNHEKKIIVSDLKKEFSLLIENLNKQYKEALGSVFSRVTDIGFVMAENILESEISKPENLRKLLQHQIHKAFSQMTEDNELILKLNPESIKVFEKYGMIQEIDLPPDEIKVIPEDTLRAGECIMENSLHVIDGRFTTQLMNLVKSIELG